MEDALPYIAVLAVLFFLVLPVFLLLASVLSDLGRQADARQILGNEPVALVSHVVLAEYLAERSVIDWRIEDRNKASGEFQTAVQFDPVWMISRWIANNYTPATTSVIRDLQSVESARKIRDAQNQQRLVERH